MNSVTKPERVAFLPTVAIFVTSFVVLFLSMSRAPNIYDEGLIITGALRVAAGQVPHRDFYANYGPAQFYILAGLFKLFGHTLLIERVFDLLTKSVLLTVIFAIVAAFCRWSVAIGVYCAALLWVFSVGTIFASPLQPVSVLDLVSLIIILPIFTGRISSRRLILAGVLAGVSSLFRYDTGIAILGINAVVFAVAALAGEGSFPERVKSFLLAIGFYFIGAGIIVLPALAYYLSVAPWHAFAHDIIQYPAKYYYRERSLPFPPIHLRHLGDLGIYLPICVALLALVVSFDTSRPQGTRFSSIATGLRRDRWRAFLFVFGLLTFVMYFKGYVRTSTVHMYLSIIPSLLLIGVLLEHSSGLSRSLRVCIFVLQTLSILGPVGATLTETKAMITTHATLSRSSIRTPLEHTWCNTPSELTRGVCFLPDDDRIQVIEFLKAHTTPGQTLLVANSHNDTVFANDNVFYFAVDRLPATHWSHFDPGLQNSLPVQNEMVQELDTNTPPYIVLDSEFENFHEPNDSWRSTGVTLLDDYIHSKYMTAVTFGRFSIWKRMDNTSLPSNTGVK